MQEPDTTRRPEPAPPRRRARWPFWVGGLVLLPVVLAGALLWWIHASASLDQALRLAQRFLPAGQTLQYAGASGSIARGGRIEQLAWSRPGLAVTVEDFELDWVLRRLLEDTLQVNTLRAGRVHVRTSPAPQPAPQEPFTMPRQLTLPFKATVPLQVDRLEFQAEGAGAVQVFEEVHARYRYDHREHALRLESLRYGQSRVQAFATLGAQSLAVSAQVGASLRDLSPQVPMAMLLHADAQGTLGGGDAARLDLTIDAREQPRDAPVPEAAQLLQELVALRDTLEQAAADQPELAQVNATAIVHPWRSQPVQSMQLRARRLNAGAFHPAAPATLITAEARVTPVEGAAQTWDFTLDLHNGMAGPWDAQRLPVSRVQSVAQVAAAGLRIDSAEVTLAGDPAGRIELDGTLPREGLAAARLQLTVQDVDLRQLMGNLPVTQFAGTVELSPLQGAEDASGWQAVTRLANAGAGRVDEERLPLDAMTGTLRATADRWEADALRLDLGEGSLRMDGSFAPGDGTVALRGRVDRLPLAAMHGRLARGGASTVSGSLQATGNRAERIRFGIDIDSDGAGNAPGTLDAWDIRTVQLQGEWTPQRLRVSNIDIDALRARIQGNGIDVALPDFASIEAHLTASAPGVALQSDAAMRTRSGGGTLSLRLDSAEQTVAWLRELPGMEGQLPELQASGATTLDAKWEGGWRQWLDGLRHPARYPRLSVEATLASERLHAQFPEGAGIGELELGAVNASVQGNLASAVLAVGGSVRADQTAASLDVGIRMDRDAQDASSPGWRFLFERMAVDVLLPEQDQPWSLSLADGLAVTLETSPALRVDATAGALSLTPPGSVGATARPLQIDWEPLQLRRTASGATRLASRGSIQGIQPAWVDALRDEFGDGRLEAAGFGTDLVLGAEWDLTLAETIDLQASVQREEGDLWLLGAEVVEQGERAPTREVGISAGIRSLDVTLQSSAEQISVVMNWDTERAGAITGRAATRLTPAGGGWRLDPQTAVEGALRASLQDLAMWGVFAPPGWRIQGQVEADLALAGSVGTPLLRGAINGRGLNVRSVLDGVELHEGVLRASLEGQRLTVEELVFQGGTGSRAYISGLSGNRTPAPSARGRMTAQGRIDWSGVAAAAPGETGITMDFGARLERMQVLVRNDRQLTLSGDLSAQLEAGALRVRGALEVNRATILLPDASAPTLGDDVIVVRDDDPLDLIEVAGLSGNGGQLESARPMDVEISLELGRDLALHGYGITTRLEGELTVRSSPLPDQPFSVFGEVRTNEGRYRAWGQALNVETGEVAFNGSYENPALNLLAIRPEIDVRAGVRVTGTLRAPQVELYSDPPLPEAEKLSWVVLGRPTAIGGGDGTSVQQAALSLLAGRAVGSLADDLGVDELGLGDSGVSVGKRVTDELYLTYEAGLSGAASTLYIFYDITRRFTIRGESGEANAIDLIYSFDFD